jgi:hypothetical protein
MNSATASSHIPAATTYAVMGKLKQANIIIDELHRRMDAALKHIEGFLLQKGYEADDDFNTAMRIAYLTTLESYQRKKTIGHCLYKTIKEDGSVDWVKGPIEHFYKQCSDWEVTVVRAGSKIRVHLTAEACAAIKRDMDNHPESFKNTEIHG